MVQKTTKILQQFLRTSLLPYRPSKAEPTNSERWLLMQAAKNNKSAACPKNIFIIGTKTGKCQLCKETKKLFLLRYGFTLCEDCLVICTSILEQLQSGATDQKSKENLYSEKEKANSCKKSQASTSNTSTGRKNKSYPKMGTRKV